MPLDHPGLQSGELDHGFNPEAHHSLVNRIDRHIKKATDTAVVLFGNYPENRDFIWSRVTEDGNRVVSTLVGEIGSDSEESTIRIETFKFSPDGNHEWLVVVCSLGGVLDSVRAGKVPFEQHLAENLPYQNLSLDSQFPSEGNEWWREPSSERFIEHGQQVQISRERGVVVTRSVDDELTISSGEILGLIEIVDDMWDKTKDKEPDEPSMKSRRSGRGDEISFVRISPKGGRNKHQ